MNKHKKTLIKILIIVLTVTLLLWVMPGRVKRHFPHYIFFSTISYYTLYPDILPLSAHNIKYYNFHYFSIDKSGYRASFSEKDYEMLKEQQKGKYNGEYPWEHYLYDGENKRYLNREEVIERGIDYFDELLPAEEEDGQYYFLAYSLCDSGDSYTYDGVICNDETNEIIEFSYQLVKS